MGNSKHNIELVGIQQEFAEWYGKNPNMLRLIFSHARRAEHALNKPLYSFTKAEARDFLKSIDSSSNKTLSAYASIITQYMVYARDKGVEGAENGEWDKLQKREINMLVRRIKRYFAPKDILEIINYLPNPCDRFLILAFTEGLRGEDFDEIWNLTIDDFDKKSLTVKVPSGKTKHISKTLMDYATKSAETYSYARMGADDGNGVVMALAEEKPRSIFKHTQAVAKKSTRARWKRRVGIRMEAIKLMTCEFEMTVPRLVNSGLYFKMQEISLRYGCALNDVLKTDEWADVVNQYDLEGKTNENILTLFDDF